MELINILVMLVIVYLVFLIIDKFAGYILAVLLSFILLLSIPYVFKAMVWIFENFIKLLTKPIYWVTGYRLILPWWFGLIIFVIAFVPLVIGGWKFRKGTPMV